MCRSAAARPGWYDAAAVERDRKTYLLHAKMPQFQRRVDEAIEVCGKALEGAKRPVLSFSAGKDSVVLLDLAYRAGFRGELILFKYNLIAKVDSQPGCIALARRYADSCGLRLNILACYGEADLWEMCGRFCYRPETPEEKQAYRVIGHDFAEKSREFCEENQVDLLFMGLAKEESKARRIMLSKKGPIYDTKSRPGVTTCCPLGNFTGEDVWAYIFSRELPYLEAYDYPLEDRRRARDEIAVLYRDALVRHGVMFYYGQRYPEYCTWLKWRWGVSL